MSSTDPSLMFKQKMLFKIAVVLILIGAINWLSIGVFKLNLVESLFGTGVLTRGIYILVGVAALSIAFNRDTYLPFLGETVLPCSLIPERTPPGATKELKVPAPSGAKVLYWAAEPAMEDLKNIPDWQTAYAKYENAGLTTADSTGVAILKVRNPQAYSVPFKGRLEPHVHYRICSETGMLGRIKTVFVSDGHIEGFRGF